MFDWRKEGMNRKVFLAGFALLLASFFVGIDYAAADDYKRKFERIEKRLKELEKREREKYKKYKKGEKEVLLYYKNGLKARTDDNHFQFQVGGRIMHDWGMFAEDSAFESAFGNQEDGARFRRVRLFLAGKVYNTFKYKFDIDVDGGSNGVTFKDMYISIPNIPIVGNFQVGHFKRPASLDSVTSSKYNTFIERSLTNTFFKTRNTGFAFFNNHFDKRLTWFTFVNKETPENPPDFRTDGDWNVTSRLTVLPYYENKGEDWLHLALSYSYEAGLDNQVRFRGARDSEVTSRFLNTGFIDVEKYHILGWEGAWNMKQFGLQSEYVTTFVDRKGRDQGNLDSYYIQGTWYVTGEHRRYLKKKGAIARFKPNSNFDWDKDWSNGNGLGALQLAVRYAELDLNDGQAGIAGGEQESLTFGVNWEWNPMSRIMYNLVLADFTSGNGGNNGRLVSNIIRFQIDY